MKNKDFCAAPKGGFTRFTLSDTPPLIREPQDRNSEDHRRNCLAWHLLTTRTRAEVLDWLSKHPIALRTDMRVRFNQLREQIKELPREVTGP